MCVCHFKKKMYMSVYVEKHGNYKNMCIILNIYGPASASHPPPPQWGWVASLASYGSPPPPCGLWWWGVWDACRHVCMYVGR